MTYILLLNDMRASRVEETQPVARAETREALQAALERESVPPYHDGQWLKVYRQGGPFEWYNPPFGHSAFVNVGTLFERIEAVRRHWHDTIHVVPSVEGVLS